MKNTLKMAMWAALAAVLLLSSLSIVAQDSTAEPAATVTQESTQDAPVTVVMPETSSDPLAVIVGLVLAFVSGVSVTLIAGAGFVRKVMNDPVKMMLAERLGNSIPVEMGQDMAASLGTIAMFVSKATDRIPEVSKPLTPIMGVNTTPDMFTSTGTPPLP